MKVRVPLTPPSRGGVAKRGRSDGRTLMPGTHRGGYQAIAGGPPAAVERGLQVGLGELRVLERAGEVGVVGGEVEVAVAAEAEQDRALLARLACAASASSITARIACADSGAGMIPSVRANRTAASNVSFWR